MRKAWLLLLVVALTAVGVSAFADGTWTAWNQGNFYPYWSFDGKTGFAGWGPEYDAQGGIDQEWTFAYSGKNYGFDMTTEFGSGAGSATFGGISWFGTWYKFFDVLKVEFGMPRINDFTIFTAIEGMNFTRWGDSNWGAYVSATPMAGLEVGAAMYVPGFDAAQVSMVQNILGYVPGNVSAGNGASVAAAYTLPDLVTIQAMYKAIGFTSDVVIGANVLALKGMTLMASFDYNFTTAANQSRIGVLASFKTSFDPITVAVDAKMLSYGSAYALKNSFVFGVEGQLEYAMGMFSLGAQVGYDNGVGMFDGGVGDWGGFELFPYLKANFDNGSWVKIGFLYATGMGSDNNFATWNGVTTAQKAVIAVPIVYVWAF